MEKIIIFGSGGHSKVVCDIIEENGKFNIGGLISNKKNSFGRYKILGNDDFFFKRFKAQRDNFKVFVAIGDNHLRRKLFLRLKSDNFEFVNIISKKATISKKSSLGDGIVVMSGAIIEPYSTIGDGCIINTGATINHDCFLGAFTHVAPGSNLAGNVQIGENSLLGIGTNVIPQIKIGNNVIIGAGSVIIKDIPDNYKAFGNPAKLIKKINIK